jgi:dephospho-CoA kinase
LLCHIAAPAISIPTKNWQENGATSSMKLFGITGGIAMGKSTAGRLLRQQGVAVIDTDDLARQVVEPGQPALTEIRERFGPAVFLHDGRLDRQELARQVFALPSARADLEGILHPRIRALWIAEADAWRGDGRACGAVIIPLLFETGAEAQLDATVCVACAAAAQARRLRERGWDAGECRQRLEAQWPVERKIARSDYVVWTDTTLEAHAAQLLKIFGPPTSSAASGGRA